SLAGIRNADLLRRLRRLQAKPRRHRPSAARRSGATSQGTRVRLVLRRSACREEAKSAVSYDLQDQPQGKVSLPTRRAPRETADVADATRRLVRALGKRCAVEDPDGLLLLRGLQDELDEAFALSVAGLRSNGFTDREIGETLGVTRQAIEQ